MGRGWGLRSWHLRLGPHSPSARPCSCRITPLQASCIPSASGLLPPHFLAGVPGPLPHTPSSPQVTSRPSTVRFRDRPLGQIQAGIQPTFPTPPPPKLLPDLSAASPRPCSQAPQTPDGLSPNPGLPLGPHLRKSHRHRPRGSGQSLGHGPWSPSFPHHHLPNPQPVLWAVCPHPLCSGHSPACEPALASAGLTARGSF